MNEYRRVAIGGLIGAAITLAVLLTALTTAVGQPEPFDTPAVAVAIIDQQMEQTRNQVVTYDFPQAKQACADAAWRPAMHHALRTLRADPTYTDRATDWADAWGQSLLSCYRGDMGKATITIAQAYDLKDSMQATATNTKPPKPRP
jgi:hypothetical protein